MVAVSVDWRRSDGAPSVSDPAILKKQAMHLTCANSTGNRVIARRGVGNDPTDL
jgi:hypothetical protein